MTLTVDPACQVLLFHGRGDSRRRFLRDGEVSGHGVSTSVFPAARRTQRYPWIDQRTAGTPPASMHGGTAALLAVARLLRRGRACANASPSFLTFLPT